MVLSQCSVSVCGNMNADTISIRKAKLYHFEIGKNNFCSISGVQTRGQEMDTVLGDI